MAEQTQLKKPELTTIKGITSEVYTSVLNYFGPVVAIYRAFETTAGMPTTKWWQKREVDKDRGRDMSGQ